jgi:hypothetical protein
VNITEMGLEVVDLIRQAQNRKQLWALVKIVMNLGVP